MLNFASHKYQSRPGERISVKSSREEREHVLPACKTYLVVERRRSLRWVGTLPCRFVSGTESLTGQLTNLSFEGACISDPSKIPLEGSEILLTLRPEQEDVTLRAKIIYVERAQFGIEFCESRAENLRVLKPFFHL